jgi:hypothetical protein
MILFASLGLLPSLLSLSATIEGDDRVVRRMVIRDEIILRIPVRRRLMPPIEWSEKKGPKCLASADIAGAMLSGPSSIDFVMRDRRRVRAEIESECPALDFYDGFYMQPDDERVCARRETIRSRVGGSCRIERFRMLVPRVRRGD